MESGTWMNSSQNFMDKEILGLSVSGPQQSSHEDNLLGILNPQEHHNRQLEKNDEILPSYDFHPIRSVSSSPTKSSTFKSAYSSMEQPHESAKFTLEKDAYDTATVAEIDRSMKKHTDNLLHILEAVSARLSQLETRIHHLEFSVDDLKVTVGNNNGSTDGKLSQLENILREVQSGVLVLHDKQEIAEAQQQLAKLKASSVVDQPSENPDATQTDSLQQSTSVLQQSVQPVPPAAVQQYSTLPLPNTLEPSQQNPPPIQLPTQLPSNQMHLVPSLPREQHYPPLSQPPESTHQQYQIPPVQPQPARQHHPASPQVPQYTQTVPVSQQQQSVATVTASQLQPPPGYRAEEFPYMPLPPAYSSASGIRPPVAIPQLPTGPFPRQLLYGPTSNIYEPSGNRPSSGQLPYPAGYSLPSGPNFNDTYPHRGSPSHYSSSSMKLHHSSLSAPPSGSTYPRLPTAQVIPHALPTATNISSGSNSIETGNRVPIDDVEKVATMGFSR